MKANGMKMYVGDTVTIVKDCREVPSADGKTAIYEGRCWLKNGKRYRGSHEHLLEVNPKFRLPDDSFIWGLQCWWEFLGPIKAGG